MFTFHWAVTHWVVWVGAKILQLPDLVLAAPKNRF